MTRQPRNLNPGRRSGLVFTPQHLAAVLCLAASPAAWADSRSWACLSGSWDDPACWSPAGVPGPAHEVLVRTGLADDRMVLLTQALDRRVNVLTLSSAAVGTATARLQLDGGSLAASRQTVGDVGRGQFSQRGGGNLAESLVLGLQAGATGSYLLGAGRLDTGFAWVGSLGAGSFVQQGGLHQNGNLFIGQQGQTAGTSYRLEGGTLNSSGSIQVGATGGAASLTHSGGKLVAASLALGTQGIGVYSLSGDGLLLADRVVLGNGANGEGWVEQAGDESQAHIGLLRMGQVGQAGYSLQAGSLATQQLTVLGGQGFQQRGGQHQAGTLQLLAAGPGRSARYELLGGSLNTATLTVGSATEAGEFMHSGGHHLAQGDVTVGTLGRLQLSGNAVLQLAGSATLRNSGRVDLVRGRLVGNLSNDGVFSFGEAGRAAPVFDGRLHNRGQVLLNTDASFGDGLLNDADWPVLTSGHSLTLNGQGLQNLGRFSLQGGSLLGSGVLANAGSFSGWGRVANSAFFVNRGSLVQDGGHLALANGGANENQGNWLLQAGRQLQLEGAATLLRNQGLLALNGASVVGEGALHNLSGGAITGSGTVATAFDNNGTLALVAGDRVTLRGVVHNSGLIDLRGAGALLNGAPITNSGLIAGHGRVANAIDNGRGRVRAEGGVLVLAAPVTGDGVLVAAAGGTLLMQHTLPPWTGSLQLDGGSLDANGQALDNQGRISGHGTLRAGEVHNHGAMQFSGGPVQVHGSVVHASGAQIVVSGGSVASFHGVVDARAGSTLRVSEGSQAVFFDSVAQHVGASFSGGGRFLFEGSVSVGDSPGLGGVAGDVVLGEASLFRAEIGGLGLGSGFDHFAVGGALQFGGTLQLSLLGGFAPQAGQRFDLFDWGSSSGRFARLDLAAAPLATGLRWDASQLSVDGSLAVAAVPEPGSWALLAGGLLALTLRRLQRRARRAAGLALLGLGGLAGGTQAADFHWSAASGQTPDQGGGFTLLRQGAELPTLTDDGALRLDSSGAQSQLLAFSARPPPPAPARSPPARSSCSSCSG
jgi:hypothetical protein